MSHGYCTFDLVCITWCYSSNHVAVNIYASSRTKVSPPCDEIRKAHPQSPLASWTTMQNIMNENITLRTEVIGAVRAPVSTQRAYPVCPGIHRRGSRSVSRTRVRVSVRCGGRPVSFSRCRVFPPLSRERGRFGTALHVRDMLNSSSLSPPSPFWS